MTPQTTISLLIDNYFYNSKSNSFELQESNLNLFIEKINQLILPILSLDKNIIIKQLHILYLISTSLIHYNNTKLKIEPNNFYNSVYYPFIFILCNNSFKQAHRFIIKLIDLSIKEIIKNDKNILNTYFFLYQNNIDILKNDILYFFMKYSIIENDPVYINVNFNDHFLNIIRKMILYYIKIRIDGLVNYNFNSIIIDEGNDMISDRIKIYETGYNNYYIQELCRKSDTIAKINENYNKIKFEIIDNELQVLLFKYFYNSADTNKNILMTLYLQDSLDLNYIKEKLPLIYKLLRSIKIKNNQELLKLDEQEYIKIQIEKIIYKRFKNLYQNIDKQIVYEITHKIINNFIKSVSTGKYIDPLTMSTTTINKKEFIHQLIQFLEFIFDEKNQQAQN